MRIISRKRLREFWFKYPDATTPLQAWYAITRHANWNNLAEVRSTYPHADSVGNCTVFNIGGNKYRLIVWISYDTGKVFVRNILSHSEYDRGQWKDDC